ncbi:MAG: methionyl-tRNA formyltransferase [Candidatus Binatia bacterium]|nr:MAG: methionyl-tRNA formyltransferase [Candidatus Binatia bacterium]
MRIVLVGQAAFAAEVLERLLQEGHEVVAVYCPPDTAPDKPDPVKTRAVSRGIPVRQHASLKSPAVREEWERLRPDLAVLAYVTQIVPPEVFRIPRLGSICFHPSLLPKYRGGSAIPWQIIKGETKTGVTVFWVDEGIDTGPILLQKEAVIDPDDTAASLYFNKLFPLGVEAVVEAVRLIDGGNAPRVPQDESQATYDPLCRDEHAQVDWSRPVAEVYNLIRGCDPQPGAYNRFRGDKLRYFDARRGEDLPDVPPGTVMEVGPRGLVIAGVGGTIVVRRLRFGTGPKQPAQDLAREIALTPGHRF